MFGVAVLLCTVCGALTLTPASEPPSIELLLLFFAGFLIQGMSEELLCRSFLMVSLSRGLPLWLCAVVNALLFSIIHLGNPGVSVIALVNIFLFGIFVSLLTLRRGSIWMVGALHSMWNFAQGNLFGIPVSGLSGIPSPLRAELAEGGWQTLINGGDFGLEGGLAVTVVMAVGCVVLLISPMRKTATSEA
jgi:membrane protease YdiL (CAAX protease family)